MEVQTPYFKRRISRIRIMPLKKATSLELVTRVRIRNIIQLIACINLILIAPLSFQKNEWATGPHCDLHVLLLSVLVLQPIHKFASEQDEYGHEQLS